MRTMSEPEPAPQPAATILLVDDEEFIRDLVSLVLRQCGYTVLAADGGRAALDLYEREAGRIDLVILDLTMPDLSGWEVLDELARLDPGVRVLVSSGYAHRPPPERLPPQVRGFI